MTKTLFLVIVLLSLAHCQIITPYYVLPVQTTQNVVTSYSFFFHTDTDIESNGRVAITFPFEFSPNALTQVTRVRYLTDGTALLNATYTLNLSTFTLQINRIPIGNITVVIDGVRNPRDYTTSSFFAVRTLFKNVVVTANTQFARVPFTANPGIFYYIQ